MSGISISRMTKSGLSWAIFSSAIRPVEAEPATSMSGCAASSSVTTRRTTSESSTTSTRIFSIFLVLEGSEQRQLGDEHFWRERFHHIFIGPGVDRPLHLFAFRFRGDHDDLHRIPGPLAAHSLDEFKPVHYRHVPVNQHQADFGILPEL